MGCISSKTAENVAEFSLKTIMNYMKEDDLPEGNKEHYYRELLKLYHKFPQLQKHQQKLLIELVDEEFQDEEIDAKIEDEIAEE